MREAFREASHDPLFWADRKSYGPDQGFLKRYIWPWAKVQSNIRPELLPKHRDLL